MKTSNTLFHTFAISAFLLCCVFSLSVSAHQVGGQNGNPNHQHVYKSNSYGQGATAGHFAKPAGSNGIVIWQAAPNRGYTKTQPGFKVPSSHTKQTTQKPVFNKNQSHVPNLDKK